VGSTACLKSYSAFAELTY